MNPQLTCGLSGDPKAAAADRWELAKLAAVTTAAIADPKQALRIFDSMRVELLRMRYGSFPEVAPLTSEGAALLASVSPDWKPWTQMEETE